MTKQPSNEITRCNPHVSVILPFYNAEKYIIRALNSVANQTYKNYEIIVVDDGSVDATKEKVELFKLEHSDVDIKYISQNHEGPAKARNTAIKSCKGGLIAFLDADDYWTLDKLEKVVSIFTRESKVDLVCHNEIMIDSDGKEELLEHHKKYRAKKNLFVTMYYGNCLSPSAVTIKRESLLKTDLFDEDLESVEEYDLWLKLAKFIKLQFLIEPLGYFFINPEGLSQNLELRIKFEKMILSHYLPELRKYCRFSRLIYLKRLSQIIGAVGKDYFERGDYKKAFKKFIHALFIYPLNYKIFIYPIYLTMNKNK